MDPRRMLVVLRRWWPLLVAGTLLAAGAAYLVSRAQPRVYEATAILREYPGIGTVGGGNDFNEVQASWYQAAADGQTLRTAPIAVQAISRAGLQSSLDADTLIKDTKVQVAPQSPLIVLSVDTPNPGQSSDLANAMAAVFVARTGDASALRQALAEIERQISRYSADQAAAQGAAGSAKFQRIDYDQQMVTQLIQQADGISLRLVGAGASVQVIQQATPPSAPISPRTLVNTLIAAILTLLVLCGLALLLAVFDTRPRAAADVATALNVPLLGTISPVPSGRSPLVALRDPAAPQADEYRLLRANLGLATSAGPLESTPAVLAVTGIAPGHGATITALNLAALAARSGMRVVVVDANLRHPSLHTLLDLANHTGLSTVLREGGDPLPLLQDCPLLPQLRILVAGPTPAEAIDLLGSGRLSDALAALHAVADVVVVDAGTAALPDATLTSARAGTTLVVARLHGADMPALATVAERLRRAAASLTGVAVTLFAELARDAARQDATRQPAASGLGDVERPARTEPRPAK